MDIRLYAVPPEGPAGLLDPGFLKEILGIWCAPMDGLDPDDTELRSWWLDRDVGALPARYLSAVAEGAPRDQRQDGLAVSALIPWLSGVVNAQDDLREELTAIVGKAGRWTGSFRQLGAMELGCVVPRLRWLSEPFAPHRSSIVDPRVCALLDALFEHGRELDGTPWRGDALRSSDGAPFRYPVEGHGWWSLPEVAFLRTAMRPFPGWDGAFLSRAMEHAQRHARGLVWVVDG